MKRDSSDASLTSAVSFLRQPMDISTWPPRHTHISTPDSSLSVRCLLRVELIVSAARGKMLLKERLLAATNPMKKFELTCLK
ncbi:hypothetical protein EYF80_008365 [Liparis tanakae]|uniref:Uncharacterized protein n=1 Tax=Liparis tanakae TaxID=230148 RepID=A0A4Z2ITT7_9TELE|nr:hypothetical protein EYF80_008365 [Liparis tanakae]